MLLCYYFMIVKQLYSNMTTLFDHLNSNSLDKLNGIKENYQEKGANSKAERMRIRKERAEKCGFKKSSFFSTFRRVEGMTPMEYLKKRNVKL